MVLLNEPRTQTDLAYSKFSSAQKNLRTFNPPVENILIGALPRALPEGSAEVKETHPRFLRKQR